MRLASLSRPIARGAARGLVLALIISLSGAALAADPATVEKITHYKGADRQAFLEAGARKEGKLLVYAVGTQIRPVMKAL